MKNFNHHLDNQDMWRLKFFGRHVEFEWQPKMFDHDGRQLNFFGHHFGDWFKL
jgi:hypothetical protein